MTVIVESVDDDMIKVNGKLVIRDMNNNWTCHSATPEEGHAFRAFMAASQNYPHLVKAEYRYKSKH